MSKFRVRHLVTHPGKGGRARYFWQPSPTLRAQGWRPERLSDDLYAAMREAEARNAAVDAWRAGEGERRAGAPDRGAAPGSVAALIRLYVASPTFTRLAPRTRAGYRDCLDRLEADFGREPVRALSVRVVRAWYEARHARTPAYANAQLRVLRLLLNYAVGHEMIERNTASAFRLTGTPPRSARWTHQAIAHAVATADRLGRASIGTAILLAFFTGQREGDVLALTWSAVEGGEIRLRQAKTGQPIAVPTPAPLAERLAATVKASPMILVSEATGRPYTADHFRKSFAEVRQEAAAAMPEIADLWFMDLRRSAVLALDEAGASVREIASITGHRLGRSAAILDTYAPRSRDAAASASAKLAHAWRTKSLTKV